MNLYHSIETNCIFTSRDGIPHSTEEVEDIDTILQLLKIIDSQYYWDDITDEAWKDICELAAPDQAPEYLLANYDGDEIIAMLRAKEARP